MTDKEQPNLQAILDKLRNSPQTTTLDPLTQEDISDRRTDRLLKSIYAWVLLGILALQLAFMNYILYKAGNSELKFEKWTIDLFMGGTLAEVFGVILVITKHLFPNK